MTYLFIPHLIPQRIRYSLKELHSVLVKYKYRIKLRQGKGPIRTDCPDDKILYT